MTALGLILTLLAIVVGILLYWFISGVYAKYSNKSQEVKNDSLEYIDFSSPELKAKVVKKLRSIQLEEEAKQKRLEDEKEIIRLNKFKGIIRITKRVVIDQFNNGDYRLQGDDDFCISFELTRYPVVVNYIQQYGFKELAFTLLEALQQCGWKSVGIINIFIKNSAFLTVIVSTKDIPSQVYNSASNTPSIGKETWTQMPDGTYSYKQEAIGAEEPRGVKVEYNFSRDGGQIVAKGISLDDHIPFPLEYTGT